MTPVPVLIVLVPVAVTLPPVWVIALSVVVSASVPLAVTSCPRVMPAVPVRSTFVPANAARVVRLPPLDRVRLALPVLIAAAGRVNAPVARSDSALLLPRLKVPIDRVPAAFNEIPRPVALTRSPKVLPLLFSVIAPVPAVRSLVPTMVKPSVPDCVIAPLLLVASNAPPTRPLPRFNAPLLVAVRSLLFTVPKVSAPLSLMRVLPPVSATAPWKSLLAPSSVMAPVPALMVLVPVAATLPAVCVIAALVAVNFSVPVAVTSCASAMPPRPVRSTFLPANAARVVRPPPLARVRLALPVLIAVVGKVKAPLALNDSALLLSRFNVPIERLPAAFTAMPLPLALNRPPKVLPPLVNESALPDCRNWLVPVTASEPDWDNATVLVRLRLPPTSRLPRPPILLAPLKVALPPIKPPRLPAV